eukprot:COSAG03_NODE_23295_length_281_cov_0.840659_1_plen_58_part_01
MVLEPGSSTPPNLHEIECAVHAYAYEFGSKNVPKATAALHDALNLQVRLPNSRQLVSL